MKRDNYIPEDFTTKEKEELTISTKRVYRMRKHNPSRTQYHEIIDESEDQFNVELFVEEIEYATQTIDRACSYVLSLIDDEYASYKIKILIKTLAFRGLDYEELQPIITVIYSFNIGGFSL